jgi:tetratricopeptide (TPR) repeat protein
LADDPADVRIIPWVLFHQYDVDLAASASALERRLEVPGEPGALEKLVALIGIHLRRGTYQEALELIERKREVFASQGEIDLLRYWRAQLLTADGKTDLALDESLKVEDQTLRRAISTAALCELGNNTGDWQPLISYLEKEYEEKGTSAPYSPCAT